MSQSVGESKAKVNQKLLPINEWNPSLVSEHGLENEDCANEELTTHLQLRKLPKIPASSTGRWAATSDGHCWRWTNSL